MEDIVAPGVPAIFRTVFGSELEPELAIRVRRRRPVDRGRTQEVPDSPGFRPRGL